jgi:hypothetical protein
VAPRSIISELKAECDEMVFLATPEPFYAVGLYYADYSQTSDQEVIELLGSRGKFRAGFAGNRSDRSGIELPPAAEPGAKNVSASMAARQTIDPQMESVGPTAVARAPSEAPPQEVAAQVSPFPGEQQKSSLADVGREAPFDQCGEYGPLAEPLHDLRLCDHISRFPHRRGSQPSRQKGSALRNDRHALRRVGASPPPLCALHPAATPAA